MSHPALRALHPDRRLGIFAGADHPNHDLVANPVHPEDMTGAHLTYHQGPTIARPRLWLCFVGDFWDDWKRLEANARDIMEGGYLDPLRELGYGARDGAVFGGTVQVQVPGLAPGQIAATYTDAQVQQFITAWVRQPQIPTPGPNELFAFVWPDFVTIKFDPNDGGSCQRWCGYHSNMRAPDGGPLYYTVQTQTECGPCNGGRPAFEALTMVLGHEVAEAISDPEASGWFDDRDGAENADIVAWIDRPFGPWTEQGYFTNERGNTIGAYIPPEQRGGGQGGGGGGGGPSALDRAKAAAHAAYDGIAHKYAARRLGARAVVDAVDAVTEDGA